MPWSNKSLGCESNTTYLNLDFHLNLASTKHTSCFTKLYTALLECLALETLYSVGQILQEALQKDMEEMVGQFKAAALAMQRSVQNSTRTLETTEDLVGSNLGKLASEQRRLDEATLASSFNTKVAIFTVIFVLISFVFVFFFIKLYPKRY